MVYSALAVTVRLPLTLPLALSLKTPPNVLQAFRSLVFDVERYLIKQGFTPTAFSDSIYHWIYRKLPQSCRFQSFLFNSPSYNSCPRHPIPFDQETDWWKHTQTHSRTLYYAAHHHQAFLSSKILPSSGDILVCWLTHLWKEEICVTRGYLFPCKCSALLLVFWVPASLAQVICFVFTGDSQLV